MKKITAVKLLLVTLALLIGLSGCRTAQRKSAIADYDYSEMELVQLDAIGGGSTADRPTAVMTTSLGVIKIVLYPEYAPNTVSNFMALVEEGFYDNTAVLGVRESAFFQGVNSDGETKTTSGGLIDNEYSACMWPFKGAVGSYCDVDGFGDSRFFIIDEQPLTQEQLDKLKTITVGEGEEERQMLPDELLTAFKEVGCAVTMSGFYTFFGQTVEGFDVIETICKAQVDKKARPVEEIKIIKIELEY